MTLQAASADSARVSWGSGGWNWTQTTRKAGTRGLSEARHLPAPAPPRPVSERRLQAWGGRHAAAPRGHLPVGPGRKAHRCLTELPHVRYSQRMRICWCDHAAPTIGGGGGGYRNRRLLFWILPGFVTLRSEGQDRENAERGEPQASVDLLPPKRGAGRHAGAWLWPGRGLHCPFLSPRCQHPRPRPQQPSPAPPLLDLPGCRLLQLAEVHPPVTLAAVGRFRVIFSHHVRLQQTS